VIDYLLFLLNDSIDNALLLLLLLLLRLMEKVDVVRSDFVFLKFDRRDLRGSHDQRPR